MKHRRGDTLIEVALAIGIFSMVAITVVSVVSASTSGAQSSLEVTITREELDAQAEALRFIHDSYVSGSQSKNTSENPYAALWNALVSHSVGDEGGIGVNLNYNPTTCSELYSNNGLINTANAGSTKPFIINTRQLNNPGDPSKIIIEGNTALGSRGVFYPPSTYPRIVYGDTTISSRVDGDDLYSQATSNFESIRRVEGIYIIAARGKSKIVEGSTTKERATFYDFYIRSCWMPPGSDRASTVSTVVRLYDPAVICYGSESQCSST